MALTNVIGTVIGVDNQPYANGTFEIFLANSSGVSLDNLPYSTNNAAIGVTFFSGLLDSNGSFSVNIAPNSLVSGSFWSFTFNSVKKDSVSCLVTVSGSVQDISSSIVFAPTTTITVGAKTYTDLFNPVAIKSLMPHWRTALATTGTLTADSKILFVGDSITWGAHGTNYATNTTKSSWPFQVAANITARTGVSTSTATLVAQAAGNTDSRVVYSGGWSQQKTYGFGYLFANLSPAAGTLTFTPGDSNTYDTFDIYWVGDGGVMTATATGGTPVVINTGATLGIFKTTVSAASAATTNSVAIAYTSGARLAGVALIEAYNSTTKRVRVCNAGISGSTAADWVFNASLPYYALATIEAYAPDLTVIMLGTNDANNFQTSAATLSGYLQQIITAAQASGDVMLISMPPSEPVSTASCEKEYQIAYRNLATANGLQFMDLWNRFGASWYSPLMNDTLHPNPLGYFDIAQFATSFFIN